MLVIRLVSPKGYRSNSRLGPGEARQLGEGVARSQQKSCTSRHSPVSAARRAVARCCALPGYSRAYGSTLHNQVSGISQGAFYIARPTPGRCRALPGYFSA